jgi:H2-forming N5,N10-methylenetetrahydromethanopterin dehydrogenase-like enzyme
VLIPVIKQLMEYAPVLKEIIKHSDLVIDVQVHAILHHIVLVVLTKNIKPLMELVHVQQVFIKKKNFA